MFCCRGSPCLDEAGPSEQEREKQEKLIKDASGMNKQLRHSFHAPQTKMTLPYGQTNVAKDNHRIRNMVSANSNAIPHNVKHVTNTRKDVHVQLMGKKFGHVTGYKVVQIPRRHSEYVKNPNQQFVARAIVRTNAPVVQKVNKRESDNDQSETQHRTSTPRFDNVRLSEEFSNMRDNDSDNLSDQQRDVLSELDDTLNKYNDDDDDESKMPKIIADILPFGEFVPFNPDEVFPVDSGVDSDEPSSRTSSVSNGSRTGIISKRASTGSKKRKVASVSFQLPEGHVDKPYAPMQVATKPKPALVVAPIVTPVAPMTNMVHNPSNVIIENRRNSAGPFKGSFMKLFYNKYSDSNNIDKFDKGKYLTPTILEKVASFENISPSAIDFKMATRNSQQNRPVNPGYIVRRHTFR